MIFFKKNLLFGGFQINLIWKIEKQIKLMLKNGRVGFEIHPCRRFFEI